MEDNKQKIEKNDDESINENANSSYSGSGGMQPGGSTTVYFTERNQTF